MNDVGIIGRRSSLTDLTVGFEIECYAHDDVEDFAEAYRFIMHNGGTIKLDGSLGGHARPAREIITPPIYMESRDGRDYLRGLFETLEGLSVNDHCGGHIHVGLQDTNLHPDDRNIPSYMKRKGFSLSPLARRAVVISWRKMPYKRDGIWSTRRMYCTPLTGTREQAYFETVERTYFGEAFPPRHMLLPQFADIGTTPSQLRFAQDLLLFDGSDETTIYSTFRNPITDYNRYRQLNFCATTGHGTLEFRLWNGSLSLKTWRERAKVCKAVIIAAMDLVSGKRLPKTRQANWAKYVGRNSAVRVMKQQNLIQPPGGRFVSDWGM